MPNQILQELIDQAELAVSAAIAHDPSLEHRPLHDDTKWVHPAEEIVFYVEPQMPNMSFGDLDALVRLLGVWVREYRGVECDFQVWAWPGMGMQKKLGLAHFVLER